MSNWPTSQEVLDRLEFDTSEIGDDESRVLTFIESNLHDLILDARAIGQPWDNPDVPAIVGKIVRASMARFLRRPEGYISSRAGEEDMQWADAHGHGGSPAFTAREVEQIREAAFPHAAIGSIRTTRFGPTRSVADEGHWVPFR